MAAVTFILSDTCHDIHCKNVHALDLDLYSRLRSNVSMLFEISCITWHLMSMVIVPHISIYLLSKFAYIYIYIYIFIIIIVIIPGQFIKRRKWWYGRIDILTMMGTECSRLDPSYQPHITFACTGCYQLHHHHRLGIITPDLSPVPIYRPRKDG